MFTGLVETRGEIIAVEPVGGDVRIIVSAIDYTKRDINLGDSVAIDGCCLTVVERDENQIAFDVSKESMSLTLIGDWQLGTEVNLEMALLPTTRLGGHLVSGHVDGLATVTDVKEDARSWRMSFELPEELTKYVAKKGSITINGVSLTVNEVSGNSFDINVIPHTFQVTTLGNLVPGKKVHIEVDLIARYLERLLEGKASSGNDAI